MQPYPLTEPNRNRLAEAFRAVPRHDLTFCCVLEGSMGRAWVDNPEAPRVFRVQTGPFIYLAGEAQSEAGRALIASLGADVLLMPSAPGWLQAIQAHFGSRLEAMPRFSFSAASVSPAHLRALLATNRYADRVLPLSQAEAEAVWGIDHFMDLSDYASPADFAQRGLGYSVGSPGEMLGAAWASLVCSRGIEVSLYVKRAHRGRGLATAVASRLLLACLERGLEPHWDAANFESARLATKLGYTPAGQYEAHYLNA